MSQHEPASDLELVSYARQGDESAFAEIVRRYSPRIFRVASRFFRQRSVVEEAAQEIFLKIFTQLDTFEGRGSLEGWLTRIATNTCINLLRSAKRHPEMTLSDLSDDESDWLERNMAHISSARQHSVEESLAATELAERALRTMSPDDRLVLLMMDGEDASVKDVVEATGWSESKVKVQAFRARRRMREAVDKLLSGKFLTGAKDKKGAG